MENLFAEGLSRMTWLILGIVLIVSEFFVPGAVVVFFGVSAIFTAIGVSFGWLVGLSAQSIFWVVSSLFLVLIFRERFTSWFPALERYEHYDEGEDLKGRVVPVIKTVLPDSDEGRVRHQGSSWKAMSRSGTIQVGQNAKITGRDNLVLYVEPVDEA